MIQVPPVYEPLIPIGISDRWFPKGRTFGLYESNGLVAPNVTSILSWKFPFDQSRWKKSEPNIDHDSVARESAERGTAVHSAMEQWLKSGSSKCHESLLPWVRPLQHLVSRANKTLASEIPIHFSVDGVGAYAGSCDGLMLVRNEVVLCDYKTKRPGKKVIPRFCEKQKLQLAAYSLAVNGIYHDQLPSPVVRTSLLFAHPEDGVPVTVISTKGNELKHYQRCWVDILRDWYELHGADVAAEQVRFDRKKSMSA